VDRNRLGQGGVEQFHAAEADRPPASQGSRPDALSAQRMSSWVRSSVRSNDRCPVGVGRGAVKLDPRWRRWTRTGAGAAASDVVDHVVHVERGTAPQRRFTLTKARIAEPELVERGQVGGLTGEQEGRV